MKKFVTDRLVDRENICNLRREQRELQRIVKRKAGVVVYGPRNAGKTSVIRNVVIEDFRAAHKRHFVFFADLLGVRSMASLAARFSASLQRCFAASFPMRGLLETAGRFLGSLRPEVSIDPKTGSPSVSLQVDETGPERSLRTLWSHIAGIARDLPSLIVLDEFQDLAFIDEAPAEMRTGLESLGEVPVILLGSKRHMLSELFAAANAPLGGWGSDLEFKPIPYDEYHTYIQERFGARGLRISEAHAVLLQNEMQRVPEAINRLCVQLMDSYKNTAIDPPKIHSALEGLLEAREGRYAAYLSGFSNTDEGVLREVAHKGTVKHPQSKTFLGLVGLSNRTVAVAFRRLWDQGSLERTDDGYRIADPLLAAYIRRYR